MKLFHRALLRELIFNYLAVFVVLLVITLTTLFIRLLGDAARGEMAVEAVLTFLGFGVFSFLPLLLPVQKPYSATLRLLFTPKTNATSTSSVVVCACLSPNAVFL